MNPTIRPSFVHQIDWCRRLGSPLYAEILTIALTDIDESGPFAAVVDGFQGDAVSGAMPLRLMGGLHRLVLGGHAPGLARHYPTAGGSPDYQTLPTDLRTTVTNHEGALIEALDIPPQTNEIGRSVALFAGLLTALSEYELPVKLLGIGSSAGLNLMLDHFSYKTGAWSWRGIPGAPVLEPDWSGGGPSVPASVRINSRHGCDANPIDVTNDVERLRLVSFVFADQLDRFERINKAIDLVQPDSFRLDEADAGTWLRERFAEQVPDGTHTVVQHSVMWQYLTEPTRAAIETSLADFGIKATATRPLAHISFEPSQEVEDRGHVLTIRQWPGGESRPLAYGHPHGAWMTWLDT